MAMGRRKAERQESMWILAGCVTAPGHPFYRALNRLLAAHGFDRFVEGMCEKFYARDNGRPGTPPGVYFRLLLVGYFEGIGSERGIDWRCSDSLSLHEFLGIPLGESTPDHSTISRTRRLIDVETHQAVFAWVLKLVAEHGLVSGKTLGIDATTLEANAAMKAIVRKETGEDWKEYLKRLAAEEGIEDPSDEDLRRFDKNRPKKVSNKEWESPTDPDSRITKMKDGRTHLAYKAEHAVDLESEFVLSASIHTADQADSATLVDSVLAAQINLVLAGSEQEVEEAVADKGYHKSETLADCERLKTRTYIPEPKRKKRQWQGKPASWRKATEANRRRVKGGRSKRLQRRRSEYVERSFAHVCETGGGRRTWLRGVEKVSKRYLVQVAAHNLGLLMRKLFGMGKPRTLQPPGSFVFVLCWLYWWSTAPLSRWSRRDVSLDENVATVAMPA
jgi:transposase